MRILEGEVGPSNMDLLRNACAVALDESFVEEYRPNWLDDGVNVLRATRGWIQYGTVGFAILCIVVGAVEALFGR